MNMSPLGILFLTGLCFTLVNAQSFVNVVCKSKNVGQYGKHTILACNVIFMVEDVDILIVTWKKEGVDEPILAYGHTDKTAERSFQPGYQFAVESWNPNNTNVSLLITNTEMSHAGKYTCTVITDRGTDISSTDLGVIAKYNKPTIKEIVSSGENGVECVSEGGYPEGKLRWIVDNQPWQQTIETDIKKTQSGLYNLSSKLMLTKDSRFATFTCVVINGSGLQENKNTVEIPYRENQDQVKGSEQETSSVKYVAPFVVIGSLIVGLLILLLLFLRRRSRQARRHSATPLIRAPEVCRCEYDPEQAADHMGDKCEELSHLRE